MLKNREFISQHARHFKTIPEVFIIESLDKEDENARRFEGQVLGDMLRLAGKNPKYYYFQSKEELPHLMGLFRQTKYRYLHISSHASKTHIGFRHGRITYDEFSEIAKGFLKLRRLFFSACQVGNQKFSEALASKNKGMHSIVAPTNSIRFDHSAAIWSAFYVSMFTENYEAMKRIDIDARLRSLSSIFPVEFFFAAYSAKTETWSYKNIGNPGE